MGKGIEASYCSSTSQAKPNTCEGRYDGGCKCSTGKQQTCCTNIYNITCTQLSVAETQTQCGGSGAVGRYFMCTRNDLGGSCYDSGSSCAPGSCCTNCTPSCGSYATSNQGFGSRTESCDNTGGSGCGTTSKTCYCKSACTPATCESKGYSSTDLGAGTVDVTCKNDCNQETKRTCYNIPLCTACTPASCGPVYQSSDQGQGSIVFSCDNTPLNSGCGTTPRTCYCNQCFLSTCESKGYSATQTTYGTESFNCTNDCGVQKSQTCYIPGCNECTLPSCPSPLSATAPTGDSDTALTDFRTCTKAQPCGGNPLYGACYEQISPQPTASIQIYPDGPNIYDFFSNTHTGTRTSEYNLNDPIRMTATYTDINGYADIEAVSVWFRENTLTGEVQSPLWIDTSVNPNQVPSAPSTNSWGFMLRYEDSSWRPYIPSYPSEGTAKWVRAIYSGNSFVIPGPGGLQMVRVTIGHNLQSSITRSENSVVVPFQLSSNFVNGFEEVAQVTYQTYLMGNDIFSFTPYDNYTSNSEINSKIGNYWQEGQLRYRTTPTPSQLYARQWSLGGFDWSIDKDSPAVTNLKVSVVNETQLQLNWMVSDSKEIYAVVGNIYASLSMPLEPDNLLITGNNLDIVSPFVLSTDFTNLAKLNTGYAFKKLAVGTTTYSDNVLIDIGDNKVGSLLIYLTVFDTAGNVETKSLTYSLGDWIITEGGFVYSSAGMSYDIRTLEGPNPWSASALAHLNFEKADISTELFGDSPAAGITASALDKSILNKSYHIRPFTMNKDIPSLYSELKKAYNDREIEGKTDLTNVLPTITQLNGNLTNIGGCGSSSICILKRAGDLEVGNVSPFVCNTSGVFFVEGNLTIHKEISNVNENKDACIFVVKGDVVIKEGAKKSTSQLQYDQINTYIMADGSIDIDAEYTGVKFDGVFIQGGLQSLGGLNMNRSLKLVDRNIYPALVIKYHSKYSVLSNIVFGSQVDILKTEMGYKPY